MRLVWAREALERLSEIEEFISKENPERAEIFVNYLITQGESLGDHPKIGRIVPEVGNEMIREILAKKYRIIYRLLDDRIEILTVFEGHRLLRIDELDI